MFSSFQVIGERLGLTEGPVVGFKELVQLGQGLHNVQLLSVDLVGVGVMRRSYSRLPAVRPASSTSSWFSAPLFLVWCCFLLLI